jgi:hypothetical protein
MSPEKQVIALAKLMGYRVEEHLTDSVYGHCYHVAAPGETGWGKVYCHSEIRYAFPDYLDDLNAIKSIRNNLDKKQRRKFVKIAGDYCKVPFDAFNLTATEQTEILLKVFDLWEDN